MQNETITLQSCDGKDYKISMENANCCETIKNIIEDIGAEETIPLPHIEGVYLKAIVAFLEHPVDVYPVEKSNFVDAHHLLSCANYVNHAGMMASVSNGIAAPMAGLTPAQIHVLAGVADKITPKDEEEIRKEQDWIEN